MKFNPSELSVKENYKLLIGSILPRPIAFVSTISPDGTTNLAPYSFFTGISSKPPTVCFSPARRGTDGGKKDTLINIEATGEFVINVVTEAIMEPMNDSATEFPYGVDEFAQTGLTAIPSLVVKAPRVKESPVNMECKLVQIVNVGPEGPGGGSLVIGEVVMFHVADELLYDGRIDTGLLKPVGRLAGMEYTTLGNRFTLVRKPYQPE
jgi:flavin reductase (DIM6/NTAB) family NADH-FMN oxidoreductase RutF